MAGSVSVRSIVNQDQTGAGSSLCRATEGERTEINHRHHHAPVRKHPGHPMRRLGDEPEMQTWEYFGDFDRLQGVTLVTYAKQQKQLVLR